MRSIVQAFPYTLYQFYCGLKQKRMSTWIKRQLCAFIVAVDFFHDFSMPLKSEFWSCGVGRQSQHFVCTLRIILYSWYTVASSKTSLQRSKWNLPTMPYINPWWVWAVGPSRIGSTKWDQAKVLAKKSNSTVKSNRGMSSWVTLRPRNYTAGLFCSFSCHGGRWPLSLSQGSGIQPDAPPPPTPLRSNTMLKSKKASVL